jgi:methylglutaconyl-CoA hydratase
MKRENSTGAVLWKLDERGIAQVILNRPEVNNAYDGALIDGLLSALDALASTNGLRAIIVRGNGPHFQAGADLKWLDDVRRSSREENIRISRMTAQAVQRLNTAPVATIALVQGGCFGGGTGIVAACDVVLAAENAIFSISEVRWGLIAAIIIPQLNDAIGVRQMRRYALTGERFDAQTARRIGLVHEVVPSAELDQAGQRMLDQLLAGEPEAIAQTKSLVIESAWSNIEPLQFDRLITKHTDTRQSSGAAEGLAAFAGKRRPSWQKF